MIKIYFSLIFSLLSQFLAHSPHNPWDFQAMKSMGASFGTIFSLLSTIHGNASEP